MSRKKVLQHTRRHSLEALEHAKKGILKDLEELFEWIKAFTLTVIKFVFTPLIVICSINVRFIEMIYTCAQASSKRIKTIQTQSFLMLQKIFTDLGSTFLRLLSTMATPFIVLFSLVSSAVTFIKLYLAGLGENLFARGARMFSAIEIPVAHAIEYAYDSACGVEHKVVDIAKNMKHSAVVAVNSTEAKIENLVVESKKNIETDVEYAKNMIVEGRLSIMQQMQRIWIQLYIKLADVINKIAAVLVLGFAPLYYISMVLFRILEAFTAVSVQIYLYISKSVKSISISPPSKFITCVDFRIRLHYLLFGDNCVLSSDGRICSLENELCSLRGELSTSNSKLSSLKNELLICNKALDDTNDKLSVAKRIEKELREEIKSGQVSVSSLESKIADYEDIIQKQKESFQSSDHCDEIVAKLKAELRVAKDSLAKSQADLMEQNATLAETTQSLVLEQQKMETLKKDHADMIQTFSDETRRISDLEKKLKDSANRLDSADPSVELENAKKMLDTAENNLRTAKEEMFACCRELSTCQTELAESLRRSSHLEMEGRDLKMIIAQLQQEIRALKEPSENAFLATKDSEISDVDTKSLPLSISLPEIDNWGAASKLNESSFFQSAAGEPTSFVVIVDKSASMKLGGRWKQAEQAVQNITLALLDLFPSVAEEGITLYFFSSHSKTSKGECEAFHRYLNVKSPERVMQLFSDKSNKPHGGTDLTSVLEDAFYLSSGSKRKSMLCITDGCPDDPETSEQLIVDYTSKLKTGNEVSLTMIQVGNDIRADTYLNDLDNELEGRGALYDIVDCIPYSGTPEQH